MISVFIGSNLIELTSVFSEIVIYILLADTQLCHLTRSKNRKTTSLTGSRTPAVRMASQPLYRSAINVYSCNYLNIYNTHILLARAQMYNLAGSKNRKSKVVTGIRTPSIRVGSIVVPLGHQCMIHLIFVIYIISIFY